MLGVYETPTDKFADSVQQGIENEIRNATSSVEKGNYFLKWILTRAFGATEDDAENGILDGPNDHGIDAVLEVHGGESNFFRIFQSKYGTSHKPDEIIKFRAKIDKFLKQNPNDLPNGRLRDMLIHIQNKGWDVEAIYVTDQKIDYSNEENFYVYGFNQIVKKMWDDISEPAERKIEKILLEESMKFEDTIIGVISLRELGELVLRSKKYIFESNIRKFLPVKTKVNKQLRESLRNEPEDVFYYNNGITIVVKKAEELGSAEYKLFAPQIVNGAQTSSTIAEIVRGDRNIRGNIQVTIITEDIQTTRNNITKFRNSQNAVKGRDLISLERFHESISGQMKAKLGYYYELQAGSWVAMTDDERKSFRGDEIFNKYLSKSEMRIPANDAIQAMAAVIAEDPAKPYGSISKFLPGGKEYEKIFKDEGLEKEDDYRLLLYPYLVKSFAEKEFLYGTQKANLDEKKYARLLYVTVYFIALQDYVMPKKTSILEDPKLLDPYFINFEANKKLLKLTDDILDRFFDRTNHIRQDDETGRDKMTLHNFFARAVWSSEAKTTLKNIMKSMKRDKFKEIKKEFEQ